MPIPDDWICEHKNGLEVLRDGAGTYWLVCANPDCRQMLKTVSEKYTDDARRN